MAGFLFREAAGVAWQTDLVPFCNLMERLWTLQVMPPMISMRDFEKVLLRARPTVSVKDLATFTDFTKEFGEEG